MFIELVNLVEIKTRAIEVLPCHDRRRQRVSKSLSINASLLESPES
jgi:hypothetical protein